VGDSPAFGAPGTPDVVGRASEQARIAGFLQEVPTGARSLRLRGEPGIGKTTLWREAVEAWRETGLVALAARPAEEERALALGGLVDLFDHVEVDEAALDDRTPPIARGRAVLLALRAIVAAGPALLAIDDLQWIDSASARALRYALRRLDAEPLGVLTTARSGSDPEDPLTTAELLPPGRCATLELGPLDLDAVRSVLGRSLSTIPRPALRRLYEASDGNPLFALELARSFSREDASDPRLPDSLQEAILRRLEGVPDELVPLLEAASALGRVSSADLRRALPASDVDRLLPLAVGQGLLVVEDDLEVRFAHPLVGSAVYARMGPLARRSLHAGLAEQAADPDLRARHLALSTDEPDAEVARLLEEAAMRAGERGSEDLAAEFARHSLRLTPAGDSDAARRRALAEIAHLAAAGEMSRALALADELVARLPPGPGRAEALVGRAELEDDDLEKGEALLVRALADAGADDLLRGRVLDQLGWLRGVFRGDLDAGVECAREALAIAEAAGDRSFELSAAAGLSNMEALAGRPRTDLMLRAIELEDEIGRPALWVGPRVLYAEQLLWAGELDAARTLLEAADAEAARSVNERWRPYGLYDLAAVESAAGNLGRADELLRQAMEAARDSEDAHVESWIFYRLALVAAWLGSADEAREAAGRRIEAASTRGERPGIARARSVLGLLALSEGDAPAAVGELTQAVRLLEEMGFGHPGAIPALPDAIEAQAVAGEADDAAELVGRLERQAAAVGSAWTDAALERSRGALLLAQGEAEPAAATLEGSAGAFERLGFVPDAARAQLLEGRAHLRAGRRTAAAEVLTAARARFAAMGASLWEARAAEELDRAAPGRAAGELTPTESRIAGLVAQGLKNREIAQALFISVATVEAHLTRIYRKLGIRSRSELTRLVTEGSLAIAGDQARPAGIAGRREHV
jgi:DNA-binding CsgD family transcriptional regulator/tetratricopeptide (TPR) repeat protein